MGLLTNNKKLFFFQKPAEVCLSKRKKTFKFGYQKSCKKIFIMKTKQDLNRVLFIYTK